MLLLEFLGIMSPSAIRKNEPMTESASPSRLVQLAAERPDDIALIFPALERTLSFAELERASRAAANLMHEAGLRFGDHIAVMTENLPETLIATFAALRSGLYVTPVNWHLTADEAEYVIRDCMAKWLLVSPGVGEVADLLDQRLDADVVRFTTGPATGGYANLPSALGEVPDEPLAAELQGAIMFYSSGTTGRPKGILRALERVPADSTPDPLGMLLAGLYGFTSESTYLSPAPLYHAAPLAWTCAALRLGSRAVVMDRFDPEQVLALIERFRIDRGQFVPTMFIRMLKLPQAVRDKYDISSMKAAVHAAAPCPVDIKQQMLDWWGPVIHEYYAGSEGAGFVAVGPEEWLQKPGTVGRAMIGTLHIVGADGETLPPGEVGVVYLDADANFEYHGDPEKTQEAYNAHGWTTLGDMGYLDEDGYLFLTDRKSHMIISGGVNIYPAEAENVLTNHPAVMDVAVIGVPHPDWGEEVKAVVQLVEGVEQSEALAEELIEFCLSRLTKFKCPRSVDFIDELPRLPTGKLLKRQLRDRYWSDEGTARI